MSKDALKKIGVAVLSAVVYGAATQIGQALGEIARDAIRNRLTPTPTPPDPPPPPTEPTRKRRPRAKR